MTVYFRADASATIGSGHVMRCLTLADQLLALGADCHFLCRSLPESLAGQIARRGHAVSLLPQAEAEKAGTGTLAHSAWLGTSQVQDARDCLAVINGTPADWIVVDHYALDAEWEALMRPVSGKLMVIDDLADRQHLCDMLLDQNLGHTIADYSGRVPPHCQMFTGPRFALLRPEFASARAASLARRQSERAIRHILVTLGGFDNDNVTSDVLNALAACGLDASTRVSVVMGSQAPHVGAVRSLCGRMPFAASLLSDVSDMASLMAEADLSIGAAGGTSWERCCLGLPTLMLVLADNQKSGAAALELAGCARLLPTGDRLAGEMRAALDDLSDPAALKSMQQACSGLTQGRGAPVLAKTMMASVSGESYLRQMTEADLEQVLAWRNHADVRRHMLTQTEIAFENHRNWFLKSRLNAARHLMIFEENGFACGYMNLGVDEANGLADWGFYVAPGSARGTGTRMGQATLAYAFETLGLNKLCGQVLDNNAASLRFHQKLGFVQEGVLREQALINDTYHALVCFGLLKREWLQSNARVN